MSQITLAAIFSDYCVLQRNKVITIFGSGTEGEKLYASLEGTILGSEEKQEAKGSGIVKNGRFEIQLPPLREGLDHTLKVWTENDSITKEKIAIGEVWLCGGQSNMELELQNCAEKEILQMPHTEMIRFYYTQKKAYMDEEFFTSEKNTAWACFGDEWTKAWSAVGFFFGKRLQEELQVPVGLIGCNWGGTSASNWVPKDLLEKDADLREYIRIYEEAVGNKSQEEQIHDYEDYLAYQKIFDEKVAKCYSENPQMEWEDVLKVAGECKYPGPMGCTNPYRPGGLYECMLKRVMPYTLQGFLYYQGESDDHLPKLYEKLFRELIMQWRNDWGDMSLPFVYVQLPAHRYKADPDHKNWPVIREAQQRVADVLSHAYYVVTMDQGEFNEIHPKKKSIVGLRLANAALSEVYGKKDIIWKAPVYDYLKKDGQKLLIYIKDAKSGLKVDGNARNFEIAGEDCIFYPADALFHTDYIELSSEKVQDPLYGRYMWMNYCEVNVWGESGIPLAPFRTSYGIDGDSSDDQFGQH